MGVYQAQVEQDEDGRWEFVDRLSARMRRMGYTREEALAALSDAAGARVGDMVEEGGIALTDAKVDIQSDDRHVMKSATVPAPCPTRRPVANLRLAVGTQRPPVERA